LSQEQSKLGSEGRALCLMQRAWLREFNALGVQLRPQAAKLVTAYLRDFDNPEAQVEILVDNVKEYFRSRPGSTEAVIGAEVIERVIACMESADKQKALAENMDLNMDTQELARGELQRLDLGDGIQVYNVLQDMLAFSYNPATREWTAAGKPELFPDIKAKMQLYVERYHLLWQRLLLDPGLTSEAMASSSGILPGQRVVTPVESLVGNPGPKLTFGLLSRDPSANEVDGKRRWVIEDLHKVFQLELHIPELDQLITDGSFVMAEGEVVPGGRFIVHSLRVPPAIKRDETSPVKESIPVSMFGGNLTREQTETLQRQEIGYEDDMHVVLSEVHLDTSKVMEKLYDLFMGYEEAGPPKAYILMGSFCSKPFVPTAEGIKSYRESFERLKLMMMKLKLHAMQGTRFIFIPGPKDPGAARLPRAPLPSYLTSDLAKDVPNVILASNPCRIRHFSKELVYFRHDVLRLLRRHEVAPLRHTDASSTLTRDEVQAEMVRHLFDQAHLVPLPLEESNVLWAFDHTLRLYPLPTAVFIGGASTAFDTTYQGCRFGSVGPFHRDASFYAYYPVKDAIESCELPDART